jgi:CheY-like chemotaxis protein
MLVQLIEHRAREELILLIEEMNRVQTSVWGLVFIKRHALKLLTNDAFVAAIKPALTDTPEAKVFVLESGDFYVAWRGMQKRVHDQLSGIVGGSLLKNELSPSADAYVTYFDPQVMGNELLTLLKAQSKEQGVQAPAIAHSALPPSKHVPEPSRVQMKKFQESLKQRNKREQLEILVVEDQQFLRRLLHEILRGEHAVNSVAGMHEGWKLYLEKAPDVTFLDIGLADGNGHDLAQAIKRLDPDSCVVMVTANNTEDEMEIARHNHADGFLAKPYCKQQIFDYVGRYVSARRLAAAKSKFA